MSGVTRILTELENGDSSAADRLLPLVYDELRRLAAARLSHEKPGQTLQATALVHEAYLKLIHPTDEPAWRSRGHFFGAAAEAMRRILINRARNKKRKKRGGDMQRVELDDIQLALDTPPEQLLALNDLIAQLEQIDSAAAQLVKLRFFAGLSHGEAARSMDISRRTADRHWSFARAWLFAQLTTDSGETQ